MNIAVSGAKLICRSFERGNQVKILSELVTVSRERTPIPIASPKSARRRRKRWSASQETCLVHEMCSRYSINIQKTMRRDVVSLIVFSLCLHWVAGAFLFDEICSFKNKLLDGSLRKKNTQPASLIIPRSKIILDSSEIIERKCSWAPRSGWVLMLSGGKKFFCAESQKFQFHTLHRDSTYCFADV